MTDIDLTPSEDLAIDVLIARTRLGDSTWTFDRRHKATLEKLAAKGLVDVHHAQVEGTIGASLSAAGRERWLTYDFVPGGARVEWAVQTDDDTKPVHYVLRSKYDQAADEEYHRGYAARHDGRLFRRWTVAGDWIQQPLEVRT